MLCINTHRGLFKFKRLPFRIKVTPGIFHGHHALWTGICDSVPGWHLINSQSTEQHKAHVYEIFKRIQDYRFKLKEGKCDFFMKKAKYLGQIIDKDGERPDPERASAIKNTCWRLKTCLLFEVFFCLAMCLCLTCTVCELLLMNY